ncbi:hypothetical protein Tco_0010651, partial [Tanacetum coccineum]
MNNRLTTAYGLDAMVSFQFSFMDGLDVMLENGPWFIRNNPLIFKSEDGLSSIATKLGAPLMLDSYTSNMCIQSWGRSSYARALIKVRVDVELKDNIVVAMPMLVGEGFYTCNDECPMNIDSDVVKNMKKPSRTPRGVPVSPKVGFKPVKHVFRQVTKKNNVNISGNKKKDVEPTIEVSNSNPFDVLNSVDNDVDLGTNGGTSNLASKKANSSGSSFWNVKSSSTSTTPIVEKIDKMEKLIIEGKITFVDDEASKKDVHGTNSLLEQWKESFGNGDYDFDPYDDDMYEGQDIPDKIQDICDNLDIKLCGRKKK